MEKYLTMNVSLNSNFKSDLINVIIYTFNNWVLRALFKTLLVLGTN